MIKNKCFISSFAIAGALFVSLACCFCSSPSTTQTIYDAPAPKEPIKLPPFPDHMDFAGEPVPLHAFDVRENLQRELIVNMNFHSNTLQWLLRTTRVFPVIEPILREQGVPDDFKYLALIESDLMNKVSPAGATGVWQIMRATALELGLQVNTEVDERYHLEKSTLAACAYLKKMYVEYGSWTMAAASYNIGRTGLNTQIKRQSQLNYYDLLLGEETERYVFRILAAKAILTNPSHYGFQVDDSMKYAPIPSYTVEVSGPVPGFVRFAQKHDTNYKLLKLLNPWLRDTFLTNRNGATYQISIPEKGFREKLPPIGLPLN